MTDSTHEPRIHSGSLADETVALVRRWIAEAATVPPDRGAEQLAAVLKDPHGLEFTVAFIDGVIRPEDPRVAARNLAHLSRDLPAFLPAHLRAAIRAGGTLGPALPHVVVPAARRALRAMVGHLVVDASDARLGRAIARLRRDGVRLNLNLLGEAVLGEREADRRLAGTRALLARDDVDYVSIKVSAAVAPHSPWAFDEAVDDVVERLVPLYHLAATSPSPKFINLDMEEYRDLDLTIAVFMKILDRPEFAHLEAGIVLQAYLPDSLAAMIRLQDWSAARRTRGGAPIKVRVVKGANLPMERVEASLHGWPLATWGSKQETDTHYKRLLDYAFEPDRIANVRIGVAGHNLFDVAHAWLLAGQRGVRDGVEFEMLLGMAHSQAEVVRRHVGGILLYTPVVHPDEFDVAIAYLVRRLEEGAGQDNFMSAVFALHEDESLFEREKQRFLASLADVDGSVPPPNRTQNRLVGPLEPPGPEFANTPDTDPSLPANRTWARQILGRAAGSRLGAAAVAAHTIRTADQLDDLLATATAHGREWGLRAGSDRAEVLERVAYELECRRGELVEVMVSEAGKTVDQADPEVSEAIDFARWYADRTRDLDAVDGARFVPSALTVVTPPWNFPVAIPAGSTLAALAAGSAVVLKPAALTARCGAVLAEAMWAAGVPRDVLHLVRLADHDLGRQLIADPRVDRVVLTGAYETAELFRSFRPDLPLLAETSGKNAIVVTPSADLDLAVRDVVQSAFGHAGQKCSAASLVILVGSVASSRRFRNQLVDAVTSLPVGRADDPRSRMGPLVEPARGKLLDALTTLGPGESWLVAPQRLDESGQLWSPGVRIGVRPGSRAHLVEFFGPVLSIMTARDLDEAIALQNRVDFGLTAGLHSLDSEEIALWLDRVEAGNLYVNRGITGAIVRRQPFGGWKRSSVGAGFKAGGPNYLVGFGSWEPAPHSPVDETVDGVPALLLDAAGLSEAEREFLRRSFASDARVWRTEFSLARDVSALTAERNLFRYRPVRVHVRLGARGTAVELLRVLGAAARCGASVDVSTTAPLSSETTRVIGTFVTSLAIETDAAWLNRIGRPAPDRIRLIGGDTRALAENLYGRPGTAVYHNRVTESGRLEMLPFLREQSVSITAHRFGTPNHLTDGIV
ncbi:proline dehydrogenase family protein [Rhodococcus sp. HM1]|nr:proline dehydrogenase family protein [Rhodococcus sp. HM1]MCK8670907.1 proline dehydrogenase family protein [Rhodococcus sp. HM1]